MEQADRHRTPREASVAIPTAAAAYLDRQGYRPRLARDALVRELASQRCFDEPHPERTAHAGCPPAYAGQSGFVRVLEAMLERKLKQRPVRVLRALEKIEEGTYGLCDLTGKPIPKERLEQVPRDLESPEGRRVLRMPSKTHGGH